MEVWLKFQPNFHYSQCKFGFIFNHASSILQQKYKWMYMNPINFLLNTDVADRKHELLSKQKLEYTYESCSFPTKSTWRLYINSSVVHIWCLSSNWINPAYRIAVWTDSSPEFLSKEPYPQLSLKVKSIKCKSNKNILRKLSISLKVTLSQERPTQSKPYRMSQTKLCDYLPR